MCEWHERRQVFPARGVLPARSECAETRRQIVGRQLRQLPQRADAPAAQHVDGLRGALPDGIERATAAVLHAHLSAHPTPGLCAFMTVARMPPACRRLVARGRGRRHRTAGVVPLRQRGHGQRGQRRAGLGDRGCDAQAGPAQRQQACRGVRGRDGQAHGAGIHQRAAHLGRDIVRTAEQALEDPPRSHTTSVPESRPRGENDCATRTRVSRGAVTDDSAANMTGLRAT